MQDKKAQLEPEASYHVYNRANGSERLFRSHENYRFFLERYQRYISPVAETFCYCLMPNHFHFLIRVRDEPSLRAAFPKFGTLEKLPPGFLSKQLSNLFSSYTQAFNKMYGRMGSLFMKNFKRSLIMDERYRQNLVLYIHQNPVVAQMVKHLQDWKFSSYSAITSGTNGLVNGAEVIDWFGDREKFICRHE